MVSQLNNYSFSGCSNLNSVRVNCKNLSSCFKDLISIKELYLRDVMSISNNAFSNCKNLSFIELGDSLTSIGESCFYGCTSLKSIRIPSKVSKIGNFSFSGCNSLGTIYSYNTTPPEINYGTFDKYTEENASLYVPTGSKSKYWIHPCWENFYHISEFDMTGIQKVAIDTSYPQANHIYDLNGRRLKSNSLESQHHSIVIINGKKYIIK